MHLSHYHGVFLTKPRQLQKHFSNVPPVEKSSSFLHTEVLSALLQGKRRNRISDPEIDRFLNDLVSFRVVIEQSYSTVRMRELRTLAEKHNLTAYDAAYLDLAKRHWLAVATFDQRLQLACAAEGVVLLG